VTCYLKYYVKGRDHAPSIFPAERMTTTSLSECSARRWLDPREGINYTEDIDRVTVDQLLDLVVEDYQLNKRDTTYDTEKRIDKHLRPYFGGKRQ
jgi:hypothetical protein